MILFQTNQEHTSKSYVTNQLFDAFLFCTYKSYLLLSDVDSQTTEYADLESRLDEEFRIEAKHRLITTQKNAPDQDCQSPSVLDLRTGQKFFFGIFVTNDNLQSQIDGVKKVLGDSALGLFHYEPILFSRNAHINKRHKLCLAYRAFVLGKAQGKMPDNGTIIFGTKFTESKIRLEPYFKDVSFLIDSLLSQVSNQTKPSLYLNRHCDVCQFKKRCREEALASDHLSLLRGISENEIARNNRKGIFTVTQLSYTFRARRRPKRAKPATLPHSYPLQALALREKNLYIHGNPEIPSAKTRIYFDIEGVPEKDFYYLIGLLIDENGSQQYHYFWADSKEQQQQIYAQFIKALQHCHNYVVFHFGSYENAALKQMQSQMPDEYQSGLDEIRKRTFNLLSSIHSHIYFPTWSNSLKEIAKFLGFEWSDREAGGLQSIVWRENWDSTHSLELKQRLIQYNYDDCLALKRVADFIASALSTEASLQGNDEAGTKIVHTTQMQSPTGQTPKFGKIEFVFPELNFVNKCAYFDYQREKVFVRTNRDLKQINRRAKTLKHHNIKPNKLIEISANICQFCKSKKITQQHEIQRQVIDLRFFKGGVEKWVTEFLSWQYQCAKCKKTFVPDGIPDGRTKYGHGLMCWCVYNNMIGGQNVLRVLRVLSDVFNLDIPQPSIYRFKAYVAEDLAPLAEKILASILQKSILHIDETEVNLIGGKGYVWVFASMDSVYFMYRESREAQFLKDLLSDFRGVLISDFFSGYDSLSCPQQKCLIHLIRDMNEDLLNNPFNEEFKDLSQQFANLLRDIVKTVDRYGLKHRHLNKYKDSVSKFVQYATATVFSSDISKKYQKRIEKYGDRLFTFLDYDGVPWNNNNAENAIKSFARYRRFADGRLTEKSLKDYLVMLSVVQTCEYRNIDILKFLLSKTNDLP
ncbi:MAG: IS66 family transposase [Nostoc indistinguendum CM1-VF10]|jgi:predicted RecB family nuclease|nr:IS66 family transposase [Nostoc indistinguendum CM1-VF10]